MIKTYKGNLGDGGQDRIRIKTNRGDIGYRITKFQIFFEIPGADSQDSIVSIWKTKQTSVTAGSPVVDFTDGNLLAVAQLVQAASVLYQTTTGPIIFDREIFNQDIYITHTDSESGYSCNYYLELEQVPLNENESTMATLQSLRTVASK